LHDSLPNKPREGRIILFLLFLFYLHSDGVHEESYPREAFRETGKTVVNWDGEWFCYSQGKGVEHGILSSAFVVFVFSSILFTQDEFATQEMAHSFVLCIGLLKREFLVEASTSPKKK